MQDNLLHCTISYYCSIKYILVPKYIVHTLGTRYTIRSMTWPKIRTNPLVYKLVGTDREVIIERQVIKGYEQIAIQNSIEHLVLSILIIIPSILCEVKLKREGLYQSVISLLLSLFIFCLVKNHTENVKQIAKRHL